MKPSEEREQSGKSKVRFFYTLVIFVLLGLPIFVFVLLFVKYLWPHMKH